jgi:ketosteroid isomerase-like protein
MSHASKLPLLIAAAVLTTTALNSRAASDDAARLRQLSQAFSDASASGDAKALDRMLDERVIFMNEGGEIATKKDIVTSATPPPKDSSNVLVQSDFQLELHGNVGVTSFTDNATFHVGDQVMHAKFRSTEVWLKESGDWRMISSQTLALPEAPPAIQLPVKALDEYVGTYTAGSNTVKIVRDGDALTSSTNNAKPTPLDVEIRDVLFTPSLPRIRRIFQRDANGKVTGFLSRREGHDFRWVRVR